MASNKKADNVIKKRDIKKLTNEQLIKKAVIAGQCVDDDMKQRQAVYEAELIERKLPLVGTNLVTGSTKRKRSKDD